MTSRQKMNGRKALLSDFTAKPCAMLVIDVQVDFVAPDGFCAAHGADLSTMPAAIARIREAIALARRAAMPVCFVRLETRADTDSPALLRLMARQGRVGAHALCRAGTRGADYWAIAPQPGDGEIIKSRYDAFLETGLDAWLRRQGAQAIVVCGVSTDCCVDATARAAFLRDYDVLVLADACAAGTPEHHAAALSSLSRHVATVCDVAEFGAAIGQIQPANGEPVA